MKGKVVRSNDFVSKKKKWKCQMQTCLDAFHILRLSPEMRDRKAISKMFRGKQNLNIIPCEILSQN